MLILSNNSLGDAFLCNKIVIKFMNVILIKLEFEKNFMLSLELIQKVNLAISFNQIFTKIKKNNITTYSNNFIHMHTHACANTHINIYTRAKVYEIVKTENSLKARN